MAQNAFPSVTTSLDYKGLHAKEHIVAVRDSVLGAISHAISHVDTSRSSPRAAVANAIPSPQHLSRWRAVDGSRTVGAVADPDALLREVEGLLHQAADAVPHVPKAGGEALVFAALEAADDEMTALRRQVALLKQVNLDTRKRISDVELLHMSKEGQLQRKDRILNHIKGRLYAEICLLRRDMQRLSLQRGFGTLNSARAGSPTRGGVTGREIFQVFRSIDKVQGTLESLDPGKGKEAAPSAAVAQQMTHLKQACEEGSKVLNQSSQQTQHAEEELQRRLAAVKEEAQRTAEAKKQAAQEDFERKMGDLQAQIDAFAEVEEMTLWKEKLHIRAELESEVSSLKETIAGLNKRLTDARRLVEDAPYQTKQAIQLREDAAAQEYQRQLQAVRAGLGEQFDPAFTLMRERVASLQQSTRKTKAELHRLHQRGEEMVRQAKSLEEDRQVLADRLDDVHTNRIKLGEEMAAMMAGTQDKSQAHALSLAAIAACCNKLQDLGIELPDPQHLDHELALGRLGRGLVPDRQRLLQAEMKQNPAVVAQIWSMRDARQRVQQFQEGLVRLRQSDRAFDIVQSSYVEQLKDAALLLKSLVVMGLKRGLGEDELRKLQTFLAEFQRWLEAGDAANEIEDGELIPDLADFLAYVLEAEESPMEKSVNLALRMKDNNEDKFLVPEETAFHLSLLGSLDDPEDFDSDTSDEDWDTSTTATSEGPEVLAPANSPMGHDGLSLSTLVPAAAPPSPNGSELSAGQFDIRATSSEAGSVSDAQGTTLDPRSGDRQPVDGSRRPSHTSQPRGRSARSSHRSSIGLEAAVMAMALLSEEDAEGRPRRPSTFGQFAAAAGGTARSQPYSYRSSRRASSVGQSTTAEGAVAGPVESGRTPRWLREVLDRHDSGDAGSPADDPGEAPPGAEAVGDPEVVAPGSASSSASRSPAVLPAVRKQSSKTLAGLAEGRLPAPGTPTSRLTASSAESEPSGPAANSHAKGEDRRWSRLSVDLHSLDPPEQEQEEEEGAASEDFDASVSDSAIYSLVAAACQSSAVAEPPKDEPPRAKEAARRPPPPGSDGPSPFARRFGPGQPRKTSASAATPIDGPRSPAHRPHGATRPVPPAVAVTGLDSPAAAAHASPPAADPLSVRGTVHGSPLARHAIVIRVPGSPQRAPAAAAEAPAPADSMWSPKAAVVAAAPAGPRPGVGAVAPRPQSPQSYAFAVGPSIPSPSTVRLSPGATPLLPFPAGASPQLGEWRPAGSEPWVTVAPDPAPPKQLDRDDGEPECLATHVPAPLYKLYQLHLQDPLPGAPAVPAMSSFPPAVPLFSSPGSAARRADPPLLRSWTRPATASAAAAQRPPSAPARARQRLASASATRARPRSAKRPSVRPPLPDSPTLADTNRASDQAPGDLSDDLQAEPRDPCVRLWLPVLSWCFGWSGEAQYSGPLGQWRQELEEGWEALQAELRNLAVQHDMLADQGRQREAAAIARTIARIDRLLRSSVPTTALIPTGPAGKPRGCGRPPQGLSDDDDDDEDVAAETPGSAGKVVAMAEPPPQLRRFLQRLQQQRARELSLAQAREMWAALEQDARAMPVFQRLEASAYLLAEKLNFQRELAQQGTWDDTAELIISENQPLPRSAIIPPIGTDEECRVRLRLARLYDPPAAPNPASASPSASLGPKASPLRPATAQPRLSRRPPGAPPTPPPARPASALPRLAAAPRAPSSLGVPKPAPDYGLNALADSLLAETDGGSLPPNLGCRVHQPSDPLAKALGLSTGLDVVAHPLPLPNKRVTGRYDRAARVPATAGPSLPRPSSATYAPFGAVRTARRLGFGGPKDARP